MSYMALYRKWRPDVFEEVKGQEHIVTTLRNQIKYERIGHAYLFCGTRGTGKTTIAKLMAKAVNCEHPIDGSPCNECESCRAIASGRSMNVIEIDAASNNGVDNIRQINNAVQYSPQSGKYLVYIIDEVHMLSIGAFNALLKTLEEPPAYVIFILATTEAHKIPVTIMSRCQRYDFKRISIETIADRLGELLKRENIEAEPDALAYVAKAADGSMRDALSILDQCIAFNLGSRLTYDMVLDTIGAVDIEVYIKLIGCIRDRNIAGAVDIIEDAIWQGKDLTQFINEFTVFIRNILMLRLNPDMKLDITADNTARLAEMGGSFSGETLMAYINILQEASAKMAYMTTKRIALEVAVIKMCKPQMQDGDGALERRMEELEQRLDDLPAERIVYREQGDDADASDDAKEDATEQSERVKNNLRAKYKEADYMNILQIVGAWDQIKKASTKFAQKYLERAKLVAGETPGTLELVFTDEDDDKVAVDYFKNENNLKDLEEFIANFSERRVRVCMRKLTKKQISDLGIDDIDLSKVHFDNIEYKD